MTMGHVTDIPPTPVASLPQKFAAMLPTRELMGAVLGPLVGVAIWSLPLGLEPTIQKALAIIAFMVVYWIMEPIDYGITALIGCYLFWALQVTKFSVAFSGFVNSTPWFTFGALLLGEAVSRTNLAKRIGFFVMDRVGHSYARLLLGIITLVWLLHFLIPSSNALLTTLAPLVIGLIAAFGVGPHSNVAKGLFVILTYTCSLFSKMLMASNSSILARGIIEEQTGTQLLWSQWFIAFLPAALVTIGAAWLTVRWLYPPEREAIPGGKQFLRDALHEMGPWSWDEKKVLLWLLLATALWATDFAHHINPAVIAIGIGLVLSLPKVGVLDARAIKAVNFLSLIFIGGALSIGVVLTETKALNVLMDSLVRWMTPLLTSAFHASVILYWANFFYHFLFGNELTVVSTSLPVLLKVADVQGYNPTTMGLIWAFAAGGKLFVYQHPVLVLGYSYGYFQGKDVLKVGAVLTLVEGLILMGLVPLYWPLIGLPWR